ncbi:hypothetical protein [Streptosporangium lutulentum]|uniref:Uncharacterized protein n=1 Tax=Streptosporangium lutulentum TaxID=1461250 RepID=A0ABT9Q872_9ACTN|nr:hypothetical protein [Streptosporangium lutulentum]MDP9842950.1 hypothetical protein [Streptosporangium lutulentum]
MIGGPARQRLGTESLEGFHEGLNGAPPVGAPARDMVRQISAEESSGARRRFMEEFPKAFGLSEHEE